MNNLKINKNGQGMIEYILIVALISISAIVVVKLFGQQQKLQFAALTKVLSGEDAEIPTYVVDSIKKEAEISPTLQEYRQDPHPHNNSNEESSSDENTPYDTEPETPTPPEPTPPSPPAPPPPPDPIPVGIDSVRHHLGDGSFGAGLGGGSLVNEGNSYSNNFNVNLQQAKEAGIRTAVLTFTVEGVNPDMLTTQNQININGINLGTLNNGTNIFEVPLSSLMEGSNNVTLTAGSTNIFIPSLGPFGGGRSFTDYDDFEFSDLNITWQR